MRTLTSILAAGLLACSMSAIAADSKNSDGGVDGRNSERAPTSGAAVRDGTPTGQYGNECAWGLANDKHVETNCSVNMTGENGKTYCFSNDKAMAAFMKDPGKNVGRADKAYGRS